MKCISTLVRNILMVAFLLAAAVAQAQPPAGYSFQAVAKDPLGNVAKNRTVYVKGAIFQTAAIGGTLMLEETFQVQSNNDGVFTIIIGQGTKTQASPLNSLAQVPWANGPFFFNLKVAIAPTIPASWWVAADNYQDYGTTQLWSVPYALYAGNASVTNVNTSIQAGPPNTFLVTDSLGNVNWRTPQAAQVNVTEVRNVNLSVITGQSVNIQPNTTSVVRIPMPGVKQGDPVLISAQGDYINWSVYNAWIGVNDTVSVRFANYTDAPVTVFGSQYKVVVIK
ncbi:hypothetical protein [Sediminibacterium ginsengisoli]|uniref:Uncharacterized protein n=1 Tax=Sediminibacterium ginsengisoli TaxID=413434 RepID=A0A1T4PWR6_9BACT|nr:hypothetical protein [Sediminibacterium ginsengisoli]SJZ95963.1 hypothetical protein SAMN04488132_1072 [Sediminibacterium ginsengisoli]